MNQAHCFNFPFSDIKADLQKCLRLIGSERSSNGKWIVLQNPRWSQACGSFSFPRQSPDGISCACKTNSGEAETKPPVSCAAFGTPAGLWEWIPDPVGLQCAWRSLRRIHRAKTKPEEDPAGTSLGLYPVNTRAVTAGISLRKLVVAYLKIRQV